MHVMYDGVRLELTPEQIAKVEKERRKRERCRRSFEKVLLHFGWKKTVSHQKDQFCYEHVYYCWYAVLDVKPCASLWMVGQRLKHGGFPGGWVYWDPESVEKEIVAALNILGKDKDE